MKSFVNEHAQISSGMYVTSPIKVFNNYLYQYFGNFNTKHFIEYVRNNFNFEYTGCVYCDNSLYRYHNSSSVNVNRIIPPCTLNYCNGSYNGYDHVILYFTNYLDNGKEEKLEFEFDTTEQYNGFDFEMLKRELTKPKSSNIFAELYNDFMDVDSKPTKSNNLLFGEIFIKSDTQSFIDECKAIVKAGR